MYSQDDRAGGVGGYERSNLNTRQSRYVHWCIEEQAAMCILKKGNLNPFSIFFFFLLFAYIFAFESQVLIFLMTQNG